MPRLVGAVPGDDSSRARTVADHLALELASLHNHHEGEDAVLWPALLRTQAVSEVLLATMQAQHAELDTMIAEVYLARTAWLADADPAERDGLAELLGRLSAALDAHLDAEERDVLPLVEQQLTAADWSRLADESRRRLPKNPLEQLLLLGVLLEDADDHEHAVINAQMPALARLLWKAAGHPFYRRHVTRLRRPITVS